MEPLLHVNEFLCFLSVQFDKIERDRLITILTETYGFRAALEAKDTLIAECKKVTKSWRQVQKKKLSSKKEKKKEKEVKKKKKVQKNWEEL